MKTARADISVDNSTVTPTTENQGQVSFFFFFFKDKRYWSVFGC